ncbi:hypothetical protein MNB_SV-6-1071 [hydrothermal vent metagenome]|uniref:Uncharacterized protein n=1 Tax=hydrothermal vent metagenome TaxID=652676 RepID=A0A1W1B8S6_9ZZZZ
MSKIILALFSLLTIFSLFATYKGIGLNQIEPYSSIYKKNVRSRHIGTWLGSSGGGFSSGK